MAEREKEKLKQFSNEQLINLIRELIRQDKSNEDFVKIFINKNLKKFKKDNKKQKELSRFKELWYEIIEKVGEFNEYGGGSYEDELSYNFIEIQEIIEKGNIYKELRKEFIVECLDEYFIGNSGFEDSLMECIFLICKTKEEWLLVIEELKKHSSEEDYNHELIMRIYREHLNDERNYLKEREKHLKYGIDYYDLVLFYNNYRNNIEKAVEIAKIGIEKGQGRIIDLIKFLFEYYNKNNDYENAKEMFIKKYKESSSFEEFSKLKKFLKRNDWKKYYNEIYKISSDNEELKAKIDFYNKDYNLVLEYVKTAGHWQSYDYNFFKWARKIEQYFPNEILEIYKSPIKGLIETKNVKNYKLAKNYCMGIKRVLVVIKKQKNEWEKYIKDLKDLYPKLPALQRELSSI